MDELVRGPQAAALELDSVRTLVRLSDVLSAARSLAHVAASVPELARLAVGADFAVVGLREPDGGSLRYLRLDSLPEDLTARWSRVSLSVRSPPTDAAREGLATFFATWQEAAAAYPHLADDLRDTGFAASVNVPLTAAGEILGVLGVAWVAERRLSGTEREVLLSLAAFTGQTVARLRLTAEQRSAAETLQRSLLTDLPRPGRLELRARYVPALAGEQVGGDWYDAVLSPDGVTTVVVGDVAGHDIPAAGVMGQMRSLLRAYVWDRHEAPSAVVRRFDRALAGLGVQGIATLVVARLEGGLPEAGPTEDAGFVLRWTNAGHPPPVVLHPGGVTEVLDTRPELLVGVAPETPRRDHVHHLPIGATLLLYTDGIVERRDLDLDAGTARLRAALARRHDLPLDDLLDAVLDEVAGAAPADDCVLLAVRPRS